MRLAMTSSSVRDLSSVICGLIPKRCPSRPSIAQAMRGDGNPILEMAPLDSPCVQHGLPGMTKQAWRPLSFLQNKTHRAERAQFVGVDDDAALFDLQIIAHAFQHVAVRTHIFPHPLIAAEAVADEIRR